MPKPLLQDLLDRGLRYDQGLLCIIDGAKGLRKAIADVFGPYAQVGAPGTSERTWSARLKKKRIR